MFFPQYQETLAEFPVEVLHEAKPPRRRNKQSNKVHTTESIISVKVKKYLKKLFGGSRRARELLEASASVCTKSSNRFYPKYEAPVSLEQVSYRQAAPKLRTRRTRKQKKSRKNKYGSLNNLYIASNFSAKSSVKAQISFGQMVDKLIMKQKKKHGKVKRMKKAMKASVSTVCQRARLQVTDSALTQDNQDNQENEETLGYYPNTPESPEDEGQEELLQAQDFWNTTSVKSSKVCLGTNLFYPPYEFRAKCSKKTLSKYKKLYQHSSLSLNYLDHRDFDADLETWTADYINGLVTVHEPLAKKSDKISKFATRKKSRCVKTNTKPRNVKNEPFLTYFGQAHLLGGVKTMEGSRKLTQTAPKKPYNKLKYRTDDNLGQKMKDIQNYINSLDLPHREPEAIKQNVPKQSIQELKKFQRELKWRIKELEQKLPPPQTTSAPPAKDKLIKCASNHELSFLNLSKFLDGNLDNKPKVINKMRYCTKKNSFNLKMKFGDKFCECCFLDVKNIPNDMCRRCNKKVYLVERICAGDGVYHNLCYSCYFCKRILNSLNLCVTRGEIFCKQCFNKYFGPEMYGFIK